MPIQYTIAKIWKQLKHLSIDEWIKKMRCVCIYIYIYIYIYICVCVCVCVYYIFFRISSTYFLHFPLPAYYMFFFFLSLRLSLVLKIQAYHQKTLLGFPGSKFSHKTFFQSVNPQMFLGALPVQDTMRSLKHT